MWVEVQHLDIITFCSPLPPKKLMFKLPGNNALKAVSCSVRQDRICSIETQRKPCITIRVYRIMPGCLHCVRCNHGHSLIRDYLPKFQIQLFEQLPVCSQQFVFSLIHDHHLLRDEFDGVSYGVTLHGRILQLKLVKLHFQSFIRFLLTAFKD